MFRNSVLAFGYYYAERRLAASRRDYVANIELNIIVD